ncbi:penicillin-binding protein 1C [Parvularcula sp. IMCC14364]|uniref:penicillin-binding protein 1C n=1 Tax=Parvularcula sp. IMCC14364 TaxID=3067902 RepID=UPI00274192BB|nr:penicillin-binding protein 1C [Parvularcula sp. IMCC14364]
MSRWQKVGAVLAILVVSLVALDRLFPPPLKAVRTSVVVTDKDQRWLHGFTVIDQDGERRWRFDADIDAIDPRFIERLVQIEDQRFWSHPGVDLLAVVRAMNSFARQGQIVSGASTITMQTARLMEPRPRTIPSKLIEMVRALQIELRLSKEEILELYLTLAPYGGNLQGIRAASLAYFGKEPTQLTDAQQALLIALPQAPEARRPDRKPANAAASRSTILAKLRETAHLSDTQYREALEATIPAKRQSFSRLAWHGSYASQKRAPEGGEVQLTLDADLQRTIERLIVAHLQRQDDEANMAVLVIESRTRKVRAMLGSADISRDGGWIDITTAERSPGSTLKPFIYGLAFEDGFAAGETLIDDAPYSFDGYRPENFTRMFHGDVTLAEALQHSLNVPAVLALDRIGPQRFAASLEAAGVDARLPGGGDQRRSLAIALGGIGLSMRDLGMLYAGLANGGQISPLIWYADEDASSEALTYPLITEASAQRLTRIMREAPAPAGRAPAALARQAPEIAFKTGTSYGYRDAWAAGYTDDYTVIVWAGHPNGTPRPGVTGRQASLPLMFEIFDHLPALVRPDIYAGAVEEGAFEDGAFDIGGGLTRLSPRKRELPPEIVFPEDGVTVFYSDNQAARGFVLAARGGAGAYAWYVDGKPVAHDPLGGRTIWRPAQAGFYDVTVVDRAGRRATSSVRVQVAG